MLIWQCILFLFIAACTLMGQTASVVNGAGATFPAPLYAKWISSFHQNHQSTEIRYTPVGSEEGIRKLKAGHLDFAASDMPLSDESLSSFSQKPLQLATVAGAVVPIYHLSGFVQDLRLTPEALAGIFLGKIKRWNDPQISSANPGASLPSSPIVVVHRIDGSGTTYVLSDYLSKVSPEWKMSMGIGSTLHWATGETANGNDGVATAVTRMENSIGYVELIYAVQNRLSFASVKNAAGHFVQANIESVKAAAATATVVNEDFRMSITNAAGDQSYPIASFTWLLVPLKSDDAQKQSALMAFIDWILSSGQREAAALGYVSLPKDLLAQEQEKLIRHKLP